MLGEETLKVKMDWERTEWCGWGTGERASTAAGYVGDREGTKPFVNTFPLCGVQVKWLEKALMEQDDKMSCDMKCHLERTTGVRRGKW